MNRFDTMNRILIILFSSLWYFSLSGNESVLKIGEIARIHSDLVQNEKLISPRKEGGVVMLVKDTALGRVLLIDGQGSIEKELVIDERHIVKSEVLKASIEIIQLTSGNYVLVCQNLDPQGVPFYRQIFLSPDLEVIRNTTYGMSVGYRKLQSIYSSKDDTHVAMFYSVSGYKRFRVVKFDINGNVIWSKEEFLPLTIAAIQRVRFLSLSDDGGFTFHTFIPTYICTDLSSIYSYWFISYVYDKDGNQQQAFNRDLGAYSYITNDFPTIQGCVNQGNRYRYSFSFYTPTSPFTKIFNTSLPEIPAVDTQSVELEHIYGGVSRTVVDESGNAISVGTKHIYIRGIGDKTLTEIIPLVREDIKQIKYNSFCRRPAGSWWVTGLVEYKDGKIEDILIGLPDQNHVVQGSVFKDLNDDEIKDEYEDPFRTPWVNFQSTFNYFSKVKPDGLYDIKLAADEYDISIKSQSDIWQQSESISKLNLTKDTTLNLPVKASAICAELGINIVSPTLIRCQNNRYQINYFNSGSATAADAHVELSIDPDLSITVSSLPYTVLPGGKLRFELPDIAPDQEGSFSFDAYLDCDSTVEGQTHCITAKIFPFEKCTPPASCWDGSDIEIQGECINDSVYIKIINHGERSIRPRTMLVLEDDIMIQNPRNLLFDKGETKRFAFKTGGKTIRIEVPQSECFPYKSNPSFVMEGCGGIENLGLVTTLPQDDDARFVSVNCNESWDQIPEYFLKSAPKGYGQEYYITDSTEIQYTYIFNSDFSNHLYLIDSLSDFIDVNSLTINSSSHPYEYTIFNSGTLKVEFEKGGPSGYFQFSVRPQKGIPVGSKIYNRGLFYKNSPTPYISNTIFHTIGHQFIIVETVSTTPLWKNQVSVKVFPNPFGQEFRIDFSKPSSGMEIEIFNMQGQMIKKQLLQSSTILSAEDWAIGAYIFRVLDRNEVIATGRLLKQ